jgi:hypothetical protein
MKIIDPGHKYELLNLDEGEFQTLTFMKREGEGYPGNVGHYGGTNLQSVLRACLDRVRYLHKQIPHENNLAVVLHLEHAILELENRAMERHGFVGRGLSRRQAVELPMCLVCGHVVCLHK